MNTITTNFQGITHTFSQFVTSQGTKISSLSKPALAELGIYLCGGLYAAYNFYQAFRCHQYDPLQLKDIFKPVKCHMLLQQADLAEKTDAQKFALLTECGTILRSIHINEKNKHFIKTDDLVIKLANSFAKCNHPEKSYSFLMEIIEDWQQLEAATILHEYNLEYDPIKLQSILQNVLDKHEREITFNNPSKGDFNFYLEIATFADKCNLHDFSSTVLSKASVLANTIQLPTRKFTSFCKLAEYHQQIGDTGINKTIKTKSPDFAIKALESAEAIIKNDLEGQEAFLAYLRLTKAYAGFQTAEFDGSASKDSSTFESFTKLPILESIKIQNYPQFIIDYHENLPKNSPLEESFKQFFIEKLDQAALEIEKLDQAALENKNDEWKAITVLLDIVDAYVALKETDKAKNAALKALEILKQKSTSSNKISKDITFLNKLAVLFNDTLPKSDSDLKEIQFIIKQLYSKLYITSEDSMTEYLAESLIKALKDTPAADELFDKFLNDYVTRAKKRKSDIASNILWMFTADNGFTETQVKKAVAKAEELLPRNKHYLLDSYSKTKIATAYLKIDPKHSQDLIENTLDVEKMTYLITGSVMAVGLDVFRAYPAAIPFVALRTRLISLIYKHH